MKITRRTSAAVLTVLLLILSVALGACGGGGGSGGQKHESRAPAAFVCHHSHPQPYEAGECVRSLQAFEKVPTLHLAAPPSLAMRGRAQCVDVSRWQGIPNWSAARRTGVRCVIIQTSDGFIPNPLFAAQANGAHRAGIEVGAYLFVEAESSTGQASFSLSISRRHGVTLGTWADTEVSGAYEHECGIVNYLKTHGVTIAGGYTSPGLWPGLHGCGYVWPAEWGSSEPSAPSGWPSWAVKFRQWCGTCFLSGFSGEVDRDEDVGLLGLAKPVPPPPLTPARKRALDRLLGPYNRRTNPHGHNCGKPPFKHAYPSARWNHACSVWASERKR